MTHDIDIHIEWEGPLTFEEARSQRGDTDWGVYQIYGPHHTYGSDSLLYIGKAEKQFFGDRLSQEKWWEDCADPKRMRVYLGRLAGEDAPDDETWCRYIDLAERLLIFVHRPAWNAQANIWKFDSDLQQVHVFNWIARCHLLPEVSGARWSSRLNTLSKWHVFKSEEPRIQQSSVNQPRS